MKEMNFMKRMGTDEEFRKAFAAYVQRDDVKGKWVAVKNALDKTVLEILTGFAKEQGIDEKPDPEYLAQIAKFNKLMGEQLNGMVNKQFKAMNFLRKGAR